MPTAQASGWIHKLPPHVMCSGTLKLAVLVNEVGSVDIDSQLLNLKQVTAVAGVSITCCNSACTSHWSRVVKATYSVSHWFEDSQLLM